MTNLLQQVLTNLQSMKISQGAQSPSMEENPFANGKSSVGCRELHEPFLKLMFPKFDGEDPNGWIYKAEQYFDYNNVSIEQQA